LQDIKGLQGRFDQALTFHPRLCAGNGWLCPGILRLF
jgi:hypothetical protein